MPQGISLSELARRLGRSKSGLHKLADKGQISRNADKTFDEEAVKAALIANTDPSRRLPVPGANDDANETANGGRTENAKRTQPVVRTEADAREAIGMVKRILAEEGHVSVEALTFTDMRMAETIIKVRERELKLAERRKEVVPVTKVREHVERAFIGYRQAIQRLPARHAAAIAASLGCDPAALDKALWQAIADELDGLSAPVVRA